MKDAGKVTLLPRGEYNSSTQYEMLDMVTFNDKSYCAVKNTKGNTPSPTSSFWMYLGLGGATASFDAIALTQAEYDGLSTADKNNDMVYFITDADGYFDPGGGGGGDMYKSTYDKNNNGKVDNAETADSVPWSGVQNKPAIGDISDLQTVTKTSIVAAINEISNGADGAIELTQNEYNALTAAEKNNGKTYYIKDADGYSGPGGGGDMYRSIYDTDNDGKVDKAKNADTVNNHTVLSNVPAGAKFTDTTYSVMTGATSSANGTSGLIPAPTIADRNKFFRGDGTYQEIDQSIIGFGTPTATINNATGTPSVTVTATGDNSAKVFNFAFMNLKGAKGDKGDKGSVEWSAMSATEKQELIDAIVDLVESDIGSADLTGW